MPSFNLIHPTVWPQYTNVTDRQDRQTGQRSDSIGRTVVRRESKKGATLTMAITLSILIDVQVAVTATKSSKFPTKPI